MPPRARKTKRALAPIALIQPVEPLEMHDRQEEWNGLVKGDRCKVKGEPSRADYKFLARVTSPSGAIYIEVIGGEPHFRTMRFFREDRVGPIPRRRARRVKQEPTSEQAAG